MRRLLVLLLILIPLSAYAADSTVFDEAASVFFVSGTGIANPGGCTKAYLDASVTALTDIVGADGAAFASDTNCDLVGDIVTSNTPNVFDSVAVGMVAYISSAAEGASGRFTITAVNPASDQFTCDGLDWGGQADLVVNVGGAFGSIDAAVDNGGSPPLDASSYVVYLYTNKAETADLDITPATGSTAGSELWIVGFNSVPGDMDAGGTYYQSSYDAYKDGITAGSVVVITDTGAGNLITEGTAESVIFANLHFTSSIAVGLVDGKTENYNWVFRNCRFSYGAAQAITGLDIISFWLFDDCFFDASNNTLYMVYCANTTYGSMFRNCVFKNGNYQVLYPRYLTVFSGCLFVGGKYAISPNRRACVIQNCTFYGQTTTCVAVTTPGVVDLINNIFMPAATSDNAVTLGAGAGLGISCNNLCWSAAGAACANPPAYGVSFTQDPLFIDAANGDFRLSTSSPCLNSGDPAMGGVTTIGAWSPYAVGGVDQRARYQFEDIYTK